MQNRLTRFGKALVYLAAAASTLITIILFGAWWAWLLLSLVVAAAVYAFEAWKYIERAYRYPQLEARVQALETDVAQLKRERHRRYQDGIDEGKMQWIGAQQSLRAGAPPRLIGVSHVKGDLVLIGEYEEGQDPIPEGTRYQVQVEVTGEPRGVVQVAQVVEVNRQVHMICVDRVVEEFWARIEYDAITNSTPPFGIHLAPMRYPPPRALAHQSGTPSEDE